ncbi:MAG: hypothetical protein JWL86_138 [Rhizobium sp.]|nr:hypothetical protein [Rhizobium sp.]
MQFIKSDQSRLKRHLADFAHRDHSDVKEYFCDGARNKVGNQHQSIGGCQRQSSRPSLLGISKVS